MLDLGRETLDHIDVTNKEDFRQYAHAFAARQWKAGTSL